MSPDSEMFPADIKASGSFIGRILSQVMLWLPDKSGQSYASKQHRPLRIPSAKDSMVITQGAQMPEVISIARQFSTAPAGRFPSDGQFSGQAFRERFLIPALQKANTIVIVNLDGTIGYGSSFLNEAFGGLVRAGYSAQVLHRRLRVQSERLSYTVRVWKHIDEAAITAHPASQ